MINDAKTYTFTMDERVEIARAAVQKIDGVEVISSAGYLWKLAEELDVSIGYISQVERGVTKISLDLLGALSSILKKDISYFVTESGTVTDSYMLSEVSADFSKLSSRDKYIVSEFIKLLVKNS